MGAAVNPETPRTVGRYHIFGEIASGGMATVFYGRLTGAAGFARPVAIKRLHPQFAGDPDFVAMFLDEARVAARILHPNVVSTLDVVADGTDLLLVMDYVRGLPLQRLIRATRKRGIAAPPMVAIGIVVATLRGLHAAHEATDENGTPLEIVHRDVSPQNILIGTDGIARVLDFGVAKAVGGMHTTRAGQIKGKIAYMAPEQANRGEVSRRSDVYAAGVVLWELLTLRRLFSGDNEAVVLKKVLAGEVQPPSEFAPNVPTAVDHVVLRALASQPSDRWPDARKMADQLEAALAAATPSEIGAWVEQVAGDELRAQDTRLEGLERGLAASSGALPAARVELGPDGSGSNPVPVISGVTSVPSVIAQPVEARLPEAPAPEPAHRRPRVALLLGLLAVVGAVAIVGTLALQGALGAKTPASPDSTAVDLPGPPATSSASPQLPPTASSGASSVGPKDSASSVAAAPRTPHAPRLDTNRGRAPAPAPVAKPDCNPPYTADSTGRIHFKPHCF